MARGLANGRERRPGAAQREAVAARAGGGAVRDRRPRDGSRRRARRNCRPARQQRRLEAQLVDGADVSHILESCAEKLDWPHLVGRFGPDWRVLLSHLVLFGYIYPSERGRIPTAVMNGLIERLRAETPNLAADRVCRGTLLSRSQYLADVQKRGFRDARLEQRAHMDAADIAHWTNAIAKENKAEKLPSVK